MKFLQRMFNSIDVRYLIKSYLISISFFALVYFSILTNLTGSNFYFSIYFYMINMFLFPFSKIVWDELRDLILGNNVFSMPVILFFALKLIVNSILWSCAIFIAPLGFLYLWFRTR